MRHPAVADRFYPGSPKELSRTITELFPATENITKIKALAVVSPHAGYVYSGALAAETFSAVEIPETVIILGPNHHGQGAPVSLSTETWDMPFGKVPIDLEIADRLLDNFHAYKSRRNSPSIRAFPGGPGTVSANAAKKPAYCAA